MSDNSEKKRIIQFSAAYDRRDPNPRKNYGIHGVDVRFVLKGAKGAMQFLLYTNWHLPHVMREHENDSWMRWQPTAADLGYHSPVPQYEGQGLQSDSCEYLDGRPCYYDGSGLQAEAVWEALRVRGDEGVWEALEEEYRARFGED